MSGPERPLVAPVSPFSGCPDLLQHIECSPSSPLYFSFFEEECRSIASRLLLGAAAGPSQGPAQNDAMGPSAVAIATSTPLQDPPSPGRGLPSSTGNAASAEPQRLSPAGAAALLPRKAARGRAGPGPSRSRTPRLSPGRSRASRGGAELPKGRRGLGALGTELPQPRGTKLKAMLSTKSRLQHPSETPQLAQHSAIPKPTARNTQMESSSAAAAAARAGARRQPFQRHSTAIPSMASCSRLRLLGKAPSPKRFCSGSTTQELVCNTTQELKGNSESKEWLAPAGTDLGEGKTDQTWVCSTSSFSSKLAPGNAVPAEQPAGDQLSQELKCLKEELKCVKSELERVNNEWDLVTNKMEQVTNEMERAKNEWESAKNELKHVKNELEQVKSQLADKTAQCEAYHQTILQAQLRAAGICPEDGAVEKSGDLGTESPQPLIQIDI